MKYELLWLEIYSRHITVIQLQGYLFFGNATILAGNNEDY